jgi:hypothetical protein
MEPISFFSALRLNEGMLIYEAIAAFVTALIVSALFMLLTRRRRRRAGLIWLFLILFLATWSGGVWIKPIGPSLWGIHWLNFFLVAVVVALIMAAFSYQKPPMGRQETLAMLERMEEGEMLQEATYVTLSLFVWLLLIALVVAVVVRYLLS